MKRFIGCLTVMLLGFVATGAFGALTNFYWTGGGVVGKWDDQNNWQTGGVTNGFPSSETSFAILSNATPVAFTSGVPAKLCRLYTGAGRVVIGSTITFYYQPSPFTYAGLWIGSGGVDFGSGTVGFNNDGNTLDTYGDFAAGAFNYGNNCALIQHTGYWRVATFQLPPGQTTFPAWSFGTGTIAITTHVFHKSPVLFTGQPTYEPGLARPDWTMTAGYSAAEGYPNAYIDLNGYTRWANNIKLLENGNNWRYSRLQNTNVNALIDANTLQVGNSATDGTNNYLNLHNCTVKLQGGGTNYQTVYQNWSCNHDGSPFTYTYGTFKTNFHVGAFSINDNTTFLFAPTGGTCAVSTGSKDRGWQLLTYWTNNFAFNIVQVNTGATVRLVGAANIEGGGLTNALYAYRIQGLGPGATIDRNGHNVYTIRSNSGITFTGAGSTFVLYPDEPGLLIQQK